MKITYKEAKEIAGDLEMGMVCYIHRATGERVCIPNEELLDYGAEPWEEAIEKVKSEEENYIQLRPMNSSDGYEAMEDFTRTLPEDEDKKNLSRILSNRKPFATFKRYIEDSNLREDWFAFRDAAYTNYVIEQLKYE